MVKSAQQFDYARRSLRRATSDTGVVAVEFALIAPLFLLLIFATMVFALYFATFVAVIHSANEGARASVGGISDTERSALATARVQAVFGGYSPLLDPTHVIVQSSTPAAGMFQVTVSYPLTDFDFSAFYNLMTALAANPAAVTRPTTATYQVTVADGGY